MGVLEVMHPASSPRDGHVIGVVEYGEVRIYDDLATASSEWRSSPDDVLSDVIVFYDSDGTWLKPIPHEGPRRWWGMRRGDLSVTFERSDELDPSVDPLALTLCEANTLVPNRHFSSLEELRELFPWEGFTA